MKIKMCTYLPLNYIYTIKNDFKLQAHPKYHYEYKIEDPHTGDHKSQHEIRDGDKVEGHYSFKDADGSIRTVKYTSDKHTG